MNLAQFIQGSSMSLTHLTGPLLNKDADGWEHNAFDVGLNGPRGAMTVKWRQGIGIKTRPRLIDVLNALRSDAMNTEETFENWCAEYGYDSDSRKAEATYNACKSQTAELQRIMGATFNVLMEDVEGL